MRARDAEEFGATIGGTFDASVTIGDVTLSRTCGMWVVQCSDSAVDLAQLDAVVQLAKQVPPTVAKAEAMLTIVGDEGALSVSDARDLAAERGAFGASVLGDANPIAESDSWPLYTFKSDEELLAAANANPLQHDPRGLWRALQDRIGSVTGDESAVTFPAYESWVRDFTLSDEENEVSRIVSNTRREKSYDKYREQISAVHEAARKPFSDAAARVQKLAFGPTWPNKTGDGPLTPQ